MAQSTTRWVKLAIGVAALPALLGGCTAIQDRRGYIADSALTGSIQPGTDNRRSVEGALGQPTFASQFGQPTWYYVTSTTSHRPFGRPQISEHRVLKVSFDPSGNVAAVDQTGLELVRSINPDNDQTQTLGRDRSFLQDLFGNIGAVGGGGPGGAAPSGPGPNGS